MGLAWEPGNDKPTMYFVFIIKTRHKSVFRGNSKITRKEISKLFPCDYLTIRRNVARWDAKEERNPEKDDGFWLLWGIFNEYIKQNIIMVELIKVNFYSVDICRLIKNQSCKKRSRKLIQTLIFSKLQSCSSIFKRRECSAYYRILFTLRNIT